MLLSSNKYLNAFMPILGVTVLYVLFAYEIERSEFIKLLPLYIGLFASTYLLIHHTKYNFWTLVGIGVLFRILFLPAIPNLSQDFYRFIWDGRLLVQGMNPYLFTPDQYLEGTVNALRQAQGDNILLISQSTELRTGMGALNASHYSNYPPVNQLCFAIAGLLAGKSILGSAIVLRILLILADVGILYFGKKLLERLQLPIHHIFWYFLNPFILIELTGNLHFEGIMLFFVVWSLYLLHKGNWLWAAILLGVSVSVKLLPLLFLPLFLGFDCAQPTSRTFWNLKNIRRVSGFYMLVLGTALLTFAPFLSSEFISNFSATIGLWFQNFEFNASIYYIIRWVGFQIVGWNVIGTVGKILPVIVILIVLALSFFRKNTTTQQLITGMLFGVSAYFLLSTTVHPWYVATPLVLSIFTKYRFPIVWSGVVILSYSAYGATGFKENLWLVAAAYIIVVAFALTEIIAQSGERKGNFRVVE